MLNYQRVVSVSSVLQEQLDQLSAAEQTSEAQGSGAPLRCEEHQIGPGTRLGQVRIWLSKIGTELDDLEGNFMG